MNTAIRWCSVIAPLLAASIGALAADAKKPAAKAAAPARPAVGGRGATAGRGGAAAGRGATGRGPTTSGRTTAHPGGMRPGPTTGRPGGGLSPSARNARPGMGGRPLPAGHREVPVRGGGTARLDEHGRVREVHARGMDIHRGPGGERRIMAERADHSRVFAERHGYGYVQRPYMYRGREFAHRTYFVNGRAYDRFYYRYPYHGVVLEGYAPRVYYAPAFYGWAYNPWAVPVAYTWAWAGNPWAVYYGAYFTPYPVYASASLWLTDYMISATLAAAYQAQMDAAAAAAQSAGPPPAALTPEVKQLVSDEVQRQLALENSEQGQVAANAQPDPASSGIVRMLNDRATHVFVAGATLDVYDAAGQECALSQGDVVQLVAPPAAGGTAASLVVLAGKGADCRKGDTVSIELADLQDMQNHMRETIDQGLGEIQSHAGQGGLPVLPVSAKVAPAPAPFAAEAPPPDPNAATEINQQVQEADNLEKEAAAPPAAETQNPAAAPAAVAAPPVPAGPPPTLTTGLTFDQVEAIQGKPAKVIDLGAKKTYVYPDMKVVFTDGKVTDIK